VRFKTLHRNGIVAYLTEEQALSICKQFDIPDVPALRYIIVTGNETRDHKIIRACCKALGVKSYYPRWVNCRMRSGWMTEKEKRKVR